MMILLFALSQETLGLFFKTPGEVFHSLLPDRKFARNGDWHQ